MLLHPARAARSCRDCRRYVYNDGPGEDGSQVLRPGPGGLRTLPMVRPPGQPTPCWQCPKIPTGRPPVPESASEFTPKLWKVWTHYVRCKAVGRFPDDPIVFEHAGLLRDVEDQVERGRWASLEGFIRLLASTMTRGG